MAVDAKKVIGMVDENDSNFEEENGGEGLGDSEISSMCRALMGFNLSQGNNDQVRIPVTKNKTSSLSESGVLVT